RSQRPGRETAGRHRRPCRSPARSHPDLQRQRRGGTRAHHRAGLPPDHLTGATVQPGRRVPAPHRTDPDRMSALSGSSSRRPEPVEGSRPAELAEEAPGTKSLKYGAWYVAEHRFHNMRAYTQTILATSIGNPLLYLYALGVGLATLVDPGLGAGEVSYLTFVAPALLASAAVTVATEEFTYPVMLGFKWNPVFFGMNAAPIAPRQIVDGIVISVTARMVVTTAIYYVFMLLFGAVPSPLGI